MIQLFTLWAFIVAAFIIGAFAGVAYGSVRQSAQPATPTTPPPALTPATYIPDDVIISNNWEAVYRKRGRATWIVDTQYNKIHVTISRNWREMYRNETWDVYTKIYGNSKYPYGATVYVNNHIEFMQWLREKYPMNYVHSPEYIEHVMKSVYKAMKNPAKDVSE